MLKPWILELGESHNPQALADELSSLISKLDVVYETVGKTMPGGQRNAIAHLIYRLRAAEQAPAEPAEPEIKIGDFVRRTAYRPEALMRVRGEDAYSLDGERTERWLVTLENGRETHIAKRLVERVEVTVTPAQPEVWTVVA